jgi:hypothetical protein
MPTKPGLSSSETWLAVAGSVAAIQQAITDPDWQTKCAALLATAWIVTSYIRSRTSLKGGV